MTHGIPMKLSVHFFFLKYKTKLKLMKQERSFINTPNKSLNHKTLGKISILKNGFIILTGNFNLHFAYICKAGFKNTLIVMSF